MEDVAAGNISANNREGNHEADGAVREAREQLRPAHRHVAELLQRRWAKAEEITKAVQSMMLQILKATREKRETLMGDIVLTQTHREAVVEIRNLPIPVGVEYRKLRESTRGPRVLGSAGWQNQLVDWLLQWEWAEVVPEPADSVTWLELLIAFEASGNNFFPDGEHMEGQHARALTCRQGIGVVAKRFKAAVQDLIRDRLTADAGPLFQQRPGEAAARKTRLLCAGITGQWTTTSTHPRWPVELRTLVRTRLMEQRGLAPRLDTGLGMGPYMVSAKPLDRTKPPCWRERRLKELYQDARTTTRHKDRTSTLTSYQAMCKSCNAVTILNDKPVNVGRNNAIIRCSKCKKRARLSAMQCMLCLNTVGKCECQVGGPIAKRQATLDQLWSPHVGGGR